jgi:hypothetical protein
MKIVNEKFKGRRKKGRRNNTERTYSGRKPYASDGLTGQEPIKHVLNEGKRGHIMREKSQEV